MYAQVVRPNETSLELEKKFVRLRIVNMYGVDIGLFDFDFDTTFAVVTLNADKQIYSRYGGRDSKSAESFVSPKAFENILSRSLELHKKVKAGELQLPKITESKDPKSYPFVENLWGRCLHCHDVASAQAVEQFKLENFSQKTDVWIYPEPISLGLDLKPDDGTTLNAATGAAKDAELKAGDQIVAINTKPANTYSDIQYILHHLPEETTTVSVSLADERTVEITLPEDWRHSDISWRRIGMRLTPSAGFGGKPLDAAAKAEHKLPEDGFATVIHFDDLPKPADSPLQQGDIVHSINDVTKSGGTQHAGLYLSLHHKVSETVKLGVIRKGKPLSIDLTLVKPPGDTERIMNGRGGGMMKGKGKRKGMMKGRMRRDQ